MTPEHGLLVGAAGLLAGGVNAIAGGGTLLSFPVLLAVGLLPGYAGGSLAYRRELRGQRGRVRALLPFAVVGGVAGAVLLLITPQHTFRSVVPYLVLVSCALLAAQPRLARGLSEHRRGAVDLGWAARLGVGVAAVYGAYFGAGLGVLLLAVLGILVSDDLQRLNAIKGVLSLLINIVGVVVFVASGSIAWPYAGILAVGAYVGGTAGVAVARHLPPAAMRGAVVTLGTAVGVALLLT